MSNTAPGRPSPPGDEIDLLEYAATWWRYRYFLLAVTVAAGLITYVINRQIPPTWETTFRLMGTEAGLEDGNASRLNIVAFRELVESPNQAAALIAAFKLAGPPHNLTAEKFLASHVDVEVIRDSTIIQVAVRLRDRDLLVELARRYARSVVETAQRLNTEGIDYTAERIRQERDATLGRLSEAESKIEAFQRRTQIEVLRTDVYAMLDRRPDALDLTVRIQGARARLEQAEAELQKQPQVRDVRRGVDSFQPDNPADAKTSPELRIRADLLDPYVNPVYEALARDVSKYRAELAALQRELGELTSRLQLDAGTDKRLARLNEAERELGELTRARDIAREAYLNGAKQYEDARLRSTVRSPRLQILDDALPPDRPVAPRAARNAAAASLLALALGAIAVLIRDATGRPER